MTAHNTMNINFNAGQIAALNADGSPLTQVLWGLLMHKRTFNSHWDELESNPKSGPRYVSNSGSLPFMYHAQLLYSQVIEREAEIISSTPDAKVFDAAQAAMDYCIDISRLSQFNRTHDLDEFSWHLHFVAEWIAKMHEVRSDRETTIQANKIIRKNPSMDKPIKSCRPGQPPEFYGPVETLAQMTADYDGPQAQIRHLAFCAAARWLPSMQNIIRRLPLAERQDEEDLMKLRLDDFLEALSKLSTMCKHPNDEHKRSQSGYGAVDAAYVRSAMLVAHAASTARRMVDDGSDMGKWTDSIRRRVGTAWAKTREDLETLAGVRWKSVHSRAGVQYWSGRTSQLSRRDYLKVVIFGHATGGVAPSLELLYHANGSSFLGV